MSKANAEQILAIEHDGGVLLRAGAGSGKTFVLVEHILYLTREWMKVAPQNGLEEFIRLKFSQIVMMTFTKKAAGEMSIRLADELTKLAQTESSEQAKWQTCLDAVPLLTVTTIDGFCRKLIASGFFPHLSTEAKIIFGTERLDQVRGLFDEWIKRASLGLNQEMLEILIREKKNLLEAMGQVFSDPGLRLAWKKIKKESFLPEKVGEVLHQSFLLNNLEESLIRIHQLDLPVESERSAFETIVGNFQATGLPVVDSVEKLVLYEQIFSSIKVLRGESGKKKTPSHESAKEALAVLRDWVKDWGSSIRDYCDHFENKISPWMDLCQSLFRFIDERLDPNQGMTFGDIEYHVALGLADADSRSRIQKTYSYFIVDEFQDTSSLQFEIIRHLTGENFKKLFCVGDAKQAIYGFRGGELSVFEDCSNLVPLVRSLANNYRSLSNIIAFNNSLFRSLLPSGMGFEGHDPFSVKPEDQAVPEGAEESQGEIEVLTIDLQRNVEEEGKFSTAEINAVEARLLALAIEKERSEKPTETCAVLYRKLKPSGELIRQLMNKKVGFTAQFKIDLLDDPVMGMFLVLLRRQFDRNERTKNDYPLFILRSYFSTLGLEKSVSQDSLLRFDEDVKYWGLWEAFKKFIFSAGMTNENSDINLDVIESLCKLYQQDPESILVQLSSGDEQRISLDFRFGKDSGRVQIMTAHASKGLQFETVYLAGIMTNGRENPDRDMFGDRPGSFTWYLDLSQREKRKSPQYLYESELNRFKNFSESKRLFYVACTRAMKKIVWVGASFPDNSFSVPKNSWIDGLNHWLSSTTDNEVTRKIKYTPMQGEDKDLISSPDLPLYFHDTVGIFPREEGELAIVSELSVTRLNSLVDCPRKFYLENTLKLKPNEVKKVFSSPEEEPEIRSSSERGTLIHAEIAEGLKHNFIVSRAHHSGPEAPAIQWTLDELKKFRETHEFISETPMKFRFFDFMVSGIPDLVLIPKNSDQLTQVWDFKTGRITEEKLNHYWIQLKAYAYALFQLGQLSKSSEVILKLCFSDERKILSLNVTWSHCQNDLYSLWRSQNEPWRANLEHCTQCPYGDICPR